MTNDLINLMVLYDIPFPRYSHSDPFDIKNAVEIIFRLRSIAKDIDFEPNADGAHNTDAIRFMYLLELLAGKRGYNKLRVLVIDR